MSPLVGQNMRKLSILAFFATVALATAGSNEPIADNELGLTAKDCASQYCNSKDGLELWLTLEQMCMMDPNPYLVETGQQAEAVTWSPSVVGSICAVMGVVGIMVGFASGSKYVSSSREGYFPVA